jgi:hypothetical protein
MHHRSLQVSRGAKRLLGGVLLAAAALAALAAHAQDRE